MADLTLAMDSERSNLSFVKKEKQHRRGLYPKLSAGFSMGGGQPVSKTYLKTLCNHLTKSLP